MRAWLFYNTGRHADLAVTLAEVASSDTALEPSIIWAQFDGSTYRKQRFCAYNKRISQVSGKCWLLYTLLGILGLQG